MPSYAIKKIGLFSVFKFGLVYGIIVGIITAALTALFISFTPIPPTARPFIRNLPFSTAYGIIGSLIMGVIYGIVSAIGLVIAAAIYNLIAALTKGIEIELE